MPTHLPPPTVVPRAPVIPAEARLKVRLWRAPRRESIPFCRGDWSIARTPSTLFIPHPPPPPRHSRAPTRESIPFCRGDWSIARTPSTSFTPHPRPPSPVIPVPDTGIHPQEGPLVPCPPKAPPPFVSSRGPARDLGLAHSPASSNRRAPCPSHYCGG